MAEQETVVALSPLDNLMVPCWVKLLFYFSTAPDASVTETQDVLRRGLALAIADMPICGGTAYLQPQDRPGWKPRQLEVRIPGDVGRSCGHLLEFQDLRSRPDLSYEKLRASHFPMEKVDTKLLLAKSFNLDLVAGIDVTAAQANFVEGGCLLGLSMWHNVVDAHGAFTFARSWAAHCRKLQANHESAPSSHNLGGHAEDGTNVMPICNDREVLERLWCQDGAAESGTATDRRWAIVGVHPPSATDAPRLNDVLAAVMSNPQAFSRKTRTCIFTIPPVALEQLAGHVGLDDRGKDTNTNITESTDAVHALLWRCIMRARYPTAADHHGSDTNKDRDERTVYQVAIDGRSGLGGENYLDDYLGDAFFFATASLPLAQVTYNGNGNGGTSSPALRDLAQTIRDTRTSITREDLLGAYGAARSLPSYDNLPYSLAGISGASMIVVSHAGYIDLAALDFGPLLGGAPEYERVPGDEWDSLFRRTILLPTPSGEGIEVLLALYEEEMERLRADEEFGRFAQFLSN
jgi:trichothecene 3-O-acetyltransferase